MPLDTLKTMLQVEGAQGLAALRAKVAAGGPLVLYHGSYGLGASAFLGHFSWWVRRGREARARARAPSPSPSGGRRRR